MTGIERLREHGDKYQERLESLANDMRAEVYAIADQIERDHNVSDREDREAISWVRDHGGLAEVKEEWNARSNLKRSLETAQAKVERQQRLIEFAQRKCHERLERIAALNKTIAEMRPRLMPEGMEWPTVDGKPVDFVTGYEPSLGVLEAVSIYNNGACEVMGHDGIINSVTEIHISAPKVPDADGVEIREGDEVWSTTGEFDGKRTVSSVYIDPGEPPYAMFEERQKPYSCLCFYLTHRAPVLAADGKPLREGETVWKVKNGDGPYHVQEIRDGVSVCVEETSCEFMPKELTHNRPESWEKWREDSELSPIDYCVMIGYPPSEEESAELIKTRDLVRRAKVLAERGA